jgi:hypothetical protein
MGKVPPEVIRTIAEWKLEILDVDSRASLLDFWRGSLLQYPENIYW